MHRVSESCKAADGRAMVPTFIHDFDCLQVLKRGWHGATGQKFAVDLVANTCEHRHIDPLNTAGQQTQLIKSEWPRHGSTRAGADEAFKIHAYQS